MTEYKVFMQDDADLVLRNGPSRSAWWLRENYYVMVASWSDEDQEISVTFCSIPDAMDLADEDLHYGREVIAVSDGWNAIRNRLGIPPHYVQAEQSESDDEDDFIEDEVYEG